MKDLNYYLNLNYKIEVTKDESEGGFVLSIPELPGCITCADNLDLGYKLLEDAKEQWIIAALESSYPIKEPSQPIEQYSGQFKLRFPKSLHKELAENAKNEGVSMNQYCLHLLSKNIHQINNSQVIK